MQYKTHNCTQGSPEWHKLKLGKISGSEVAKILVGGKGVTRDKYLYKLAAEIITERRSDEDIKQFETVHMKRGKKFEDTARALYSEKTNSNVLLAGFLELNPYVGYSPDGLVGSEGLLEIKCPDTYYYLQDVCESKIDKEYHAQIQLGLFVTGREWCDIAFYNPYFEKKSIYIIRVEKDKEFQEKLEEAIKSSIARIEELIVIFNEKIK